MENRYITAAFLVLLGAGCTSATTPPATDNTATSETEQRAEENTTSESNVEGVATEVVIVADSASTPIAREEAPAAVEEAEKSNEALNITVTASNFAFAPAAITAKAGQTVNVTFVNEEGFHDFVIDGIAASGTLKAGASETVTFTAPDAGTYAYYCSVGEHRAMGMEGTLVVTE